MRPAIILASTLCLLIVSADALANDTEELNDFYRISTNGNFDLSAAAADFGNDIVSDAPIDEPLIVGKRDYIIRSLRPFADMVSAGMTLERRTYVVRRVVSGDIAHDVGYFYSVLGAPSGNSLEIVQKFSMVFQKERGEWKIITWFDAGTAPLDVLDGLDARYVID